MGVRVIGSVKEASDATSFLVTEKTGVYHSVRNPTGWFPPNEDITQVTTAQLIIAPANSKTLLPGNPLSPIDVRSVLPNVIGTPYLVSAATTTNTEKFVDGIYEFQLIYAGTWGVNLLQWRYRVAFIAQACCCIEQLGLTVQQSGCDCTSAPYLDWVRGKLALEAVISDYGCAKANKTVEALKELKSICERNPCDTCH